MNKEKAQVFEGILSVIVNGILFGVKFWAGTVSGSIALIADAWHTLSDSLTSVFVAFSVKLQSQKADKEHPFGHGRWEQISSIFIALILGIIAYEFFTGSIDKLQSRTPAKEFGKIAIIVTIISIIIKEILTQIAFYIARKTDNVIVRADGWHHRSDSLSSVVVLIGILVTRFVAADLWWMDGALGIFCALAIFYAAFQVMKESVSKLLGEEPDQEFIDKIKNEVKLIYNDDMDIHHVHLHNYISQKELTLHLRLDKNMSIYTSHKIATEIEEMILEKFKMVATIHVEPIKK